MFDGLISGRVRRLLYLASVLLLIVVVVVRVVLGTDPADGSTVIARELVSSVAGAIVVWLLGLLFLRVFISSETRARETQVIHGDEGAKEFCRLAGRAVVWFHHGQIGRWVRENVLPEFIKRSARSPAPLRIVVILLDPTNHPVCESHAMRRNSRRRKESTPFTAGHIKVEIAATVLSLAKAQAACPQLQVRVLVTDLDNPFRLDLSDTYGFITHEDQTAPAFGFEAESPYYATSYSYFSNFQSVNARELDLQSITASTSNLNERNIRGALEAMNIGFPELVKTATRTQILDFVKKVLD
ncbi:hypothetical protein [Pseudarthrobacter sp. BRE9]|uniref:hypothetical protein n=1 Tax=Pseudarthrobacter sp. BRE9 TaxID=2962582 RepID=UPI0028827FE3|nr:hypothetical protein [Pseudarthrobacter sp. BRE9]MDT0169452.1 hypothetical protein [Pseudarthrobacter sp. BRE9]